MKNRTPATRAAYIAWIPGFGCMLLGALAGAYADYMDGYSYRYLWNGFLGNLVIGGTLFTVICFFALWAVFAIFRKPRRCPYCDERVPGNAKFCGRCGMDIALETAIESLPPLKK